MYKSKRDVISDYPELELTEFGDFIIKEYIREYEVDELIELMKNFPNTYTDISLSSSIENVY